MTAPARSRVALAGAFTAALLCAIVGGLELFRSLDAPRDVWRTAERHLARADGFERDGRLADATSEYRRALALAGAAGDPALEARAANRLSALHRRRGDASTARALADDALRAATLAESDGERAAAHFNLGSAAYASGRAREALRSFEVSAGLASGAGQPEAEARARLHAGLTALMLDRRDDALDALERAAALSRELGDVEGEAAATRALGQVYSRRGAYQEALDRYAEARRLLEPSGDAEGQAVLLNAIGQVYLDLGNPETALASFRQSLALSRRLDYPLREAASLSEMGRCYLEMGELEPASKHVGDALRIYRELGNARLEADLLVELGRLSELGGDEAEAFRRFEEAIALKRAVGDTRYLAYALNESARLHVGLGRHGEARRRALEALELSRGVHDPWGESLALHQMASADRAEGKLDDALAHIEASLEILEDVRTRVASHALRTSFLSLVHERYGFLVDLLVRLHRARPGRGYDDLALRASERARARTLLDSLGEAATDLRADAAPGLLSEERALRERLNAAAREQLMLSPEAVAEASELEREIDELAAELDRVQARIRSSSPRYRALTAPDTPGVDELRGLLDGGTRLLVVALGEERSFAWSTTGADELTLAELPPQREIEALARRAHAALASARGSERLEEDLLALRRILLDPAGLGGESRLVVVADSALAYLPFGVLPLPSGAPLVTATEVIRLPSLSVLPLLREQSGGRDHEKLALVVADPVYSFEDPRAGDTSTRAADVSGRVELERLRFSREEAESMEALGTGGVDALLGFDANRQRVETLDLTPYRVVHFATHALVDDERPELSGVVLSLLDGAGRPRDGFLRLNDVYGLELGAELVVLSACRTAAGAEERGEGIVGLVRGFMYAGARSVLASAWKVDDEATAELMKRFYERLFSGVPRARALREAQVAMLETERFRSPYYWAAFELQGDWR